MGSGAAGVRCRVYGGEAVDNFFCEKIWKVRGNVVIDTDFIFTTIKVNFDVNFRQFKDKFCSCSNEMLLCRILRAKQN